MVKGRSGGRNKKDGAAKSSSEMRRLLRVIYCMTLRYRDSSSEMISLSRFPSTAALVAVLSLESERHSLGGHCKLLRKQK